MRRGGEQPKGNDPSATQVNSIRPVIVTSLLGKDEVQKTLATFGGGRGILRFHAVKPDSPKPKQGNRDDEGWLEVEGSEGFRTKSGDLFGTAGPIALAPQFAEQESERP